MPFVRHHILFVRYEELVLVSAVSPERLSQMAEASGNWPAHAVALDLVRRATRLAVIAVKAAHFELASTPAGTQFIAPRFPLLGFPVYQPKKLFIHRARRFHMPRSLFHRFI